LPAREQVEETCICLPIDRGLRPGEEAGARPARDLAEEELGLETRGAIGNRGERDRGVTEE
jgi:hypothetical protein